MGPQMQFLPVLPPKFCNARSQDIWLTAPPVDQALIVQVLILPYNLPPISIYVFQPGHGACTLPVLQVRQIQWFPALKNKTRCFSAYTFPPLPYFLFSQVCTSPFANLAQLY